MQLPEGWGTLPDVQKTVEHARCLPAVGEPLRFNGGLNVKANQQQSDREPGQSLLQRMND